ncbi:gliding motility-associated C-terminal domain-containing protein (plasmid) [Bernardetia sp. ABR2-2B]|uniref:gliding motility-associated C-terminal domain-containing protein n=1 Tax=Bernardetia sp. ABR2-2B TaxID=3127472 RepID=UPI0030D2E8B9
MKALFLLRITLIFVFLSFSHLVKAQCELTTEGKEFWVGFLENYAGFGIKTLELRITSSVATNCRVYTQGGTTLFATVSIAANTSTSIVITPYSSYSFTDQQVLLQGIYVEADDNVSVYALHTSESSSDATVIYPVNTLGKKHYALTQKANGDPIIATLGELSAAQFNIIATEDNTSVEITPTAETEQGNLPHIPFTILLNRGESYLVQAKYFLEGEDGDLSSSKISATRPIAVFSGNIRSRVGDNQFGSNHHYEQLPSTERWGRSFITVPDVVNTSPSILRRFDLFKIIAQSDGTLINISGDPSSPISLNEGEFYQFRTLGDNTPRFIEASKPILVGHLATSDYDASSSNRGDSHFTLLSPNGQTIKNINFDAMSTFRIDEYHLKVITKTGNINNILLDGANTLSFIPIVGTNYSYARSVLTSGVHNLNNSSSANEGFIAYVYGHGLAESYGYSVGTSLLNLMGLGEDELHCEGLVTEKLLRGGANFETYQWRRLPNPTLLATTQEYVATQTGSYELTATDATGCVDRDTIELTFSPPPIATITHNNTSLDTLRICDSLGVQMISALDNTHTSFTSYKWYEVGNTTPLSNNATLSVNNFSSSTTYAVKVDNPSSACNALDKGNSYDTLTVIFEPTHNVDIEYAAQSAPDTLFFCDEEGEQELILSNLPTDAQISWYQDGSLVGNTASISVNNFSSISRYSVEVTRSEQTISCPQTDEIVIVFTASPITQIKINQQNVSTQNLIYCDADGAQILNAQDPSHSSLIEYNWYQTNTVSEPLGTPFATTPAVQTTHFSSTKIYTLVVTDASNSAACGDTTFVEIEFKPSPNPTIYHNNQVANPTLYFCDNDNKQLLYVDSTANTNTTTYQWFDTQTNTLVSSFASLWVDNFSATRTYRVEVTYIYSEISCSQTDEVTVVFTPPPTTQIKINLQDVSTQTLVYCDGDGAQTLNAQDPSHSSQTEYYWYQTNTVSEPLGTPFATTPAVQTTHFSSTRIYTLIVKDPSNPAFCGDTTFVEIEFKPSPNPTIYHNNQLADTVLRFCDNDNRQLLYVDSVANTNITTYQWFEQETNTLLSTFGSLWVDNFSDTTVYRVEANLNGCIEKDTIKVIFFPAAVILQGNELAADSLIFCDTDGTQTLEAGYTSNTGQVTYSWKDITNPSLITVVGTDRILPVANFSDTTRYEITIVDAINGILNSCKVKDTVTVIFFGNSAVQIKKEGETNFPDSLFLCASEGRVNLTTGLPAYLLPTTSFEWSELAAPTTIIGINSTLSIDEFIPHQTITKKYKVRISNSIFGCQANDTITVVFLPPLSASLTGNNTICERDISPITFELSGAFPLKLTYRETSTGGLTQIREVYVGTETTPSPFEYTIQSEGGTYQIVSLLDTLCSLAPVPNTIVEVAVTPTPTVILSSPDTSICANQTTKFVAEGATNYVFYKNGLPMPAGAVANEYEPIAGTFQNGDEIWVIGETNGCPDTSRVMTMIVYPLPVVDLGVDKYKCKTDTAFIVAPEGDFIYDWKSLDENGDIISVGNGNDTLFVLDTGTYFIRLENAITRCASTSNRVKVFNFDDEVVVDLGEDKTVCSPADLPYRLVGSDLSHLAGTTYEWYVAGENTIIATDSVFDVTEENTYSLVVQDPRGCRISDTVRINFAPTPDFVITGAENPNCSTFDTLTIERSNVKGMIINWFGNGIVSTSDSSKVAIVNVSGIYKATITDTTTSANCSYSQSVEVFVRPTIDLGISSTSDTIRICEGDSLVLNAFRPEHNNNFSYQWRVIETNQTISTNSKIAIKQSMVDNYSANRFEIKVTDPNLTGGGNCSILDTVIVRFDRKSGVQIDSTFIKTLCLGQTQTLSAVGADSYEWSNGETTESIEITPTEAGFYTFIVKGIFSTPNRCGASADTIKFRVVPVPEIDVPESLVICENDSVEVDAFLPSHQPRYIYEWTNENTGELLDSIASYTFKQDTSNINYETQTYKVGVYDTLGGGRCGAESLITVTFNRSATTKIIASDTLVCVGEEITLSAMGATNFLWNTGETTQEITFSSDSAGVFRYTVVGSYGDATNQNVCQSTEKSILVQFKPLPTVTLNTPDSVSICAGESVEFIANGGATYTWSHSPAASGDTVVVSPTNTTTYIVTGFDTLGCSSTDTTVILVQPKIDLGADKQLCEGDTAIIGAERPEGATYLWNTGQISDSIRVRKSGLYYVEVSINECSYTDSIRVDFKEAPMLSAKDTILCFEDENSNRIFHQIGVTINNYDSTATYRYQWFDENNELVGQDSLLSTEFGGTFLVRVTAAYPNACNGITSLEIESNCDPQIFIPSAFTPNNDNLNEEWEIFGRFYSNLRIKVLDRWGMEVYSALQKRSDEQITFWDGTYKGKKVPAGVYYYEVTYTNPTDRSKTIKQTGTVTIIY